MFSWDTDGAGFLETADRCASRSGLSEDARVEALIASGEIHAGLGDPKGAETALRRALAVKPGSEAAIRLARLLRDRPEEALQCARTAGRLATKDRQRAVADALGADILVDLGDAAAAEVSARRALDRAPGDLDALRILVRLNLARPKRARGYAAQACRVAESAPEWYRGSALKVCARLRVKLKEDAAAVDAYRRALSLDPSDRDALDSLIALRRHGRLPASEAPPEPATERPVQVRVDPGELESAHERFRLSRAAGKKEEAVESAREFTASIGGAPTWLRYDAFKTCAAMWLELGQRDNALYCLAPLATLQSKPDLIYYSAVSKSRPYVGPWWGGIQKLVDQHLELQDEPGAEAVLQQALRIDEDNIHLLQMMARFKLSRGKPDEALPYARRMARAVENISSRDLIWGLEHDRQVRTPPGPRLGNEDRNLADAERSRLRAAALATLSEIQGSGGGSRLNRQNLDRGSRD